MQLYYFYFFRFVRLPISTFHFSIPLHSFRFLSSPFLSFCITFLSLYLFGSVCYPSYSSTSFSSRFFPSFSPFSALKLLVGKNSEIKNQKHYVYLYFDLNHFLHQYYYHYNYKTSVRDKTEMCVIIQNSTNRLSKLICKEFVH